MFLNELMLIKQVNQKSAIFLTIGIYESCYMTINILNNKSADYCCIISGISKNEAINLMQNADLTEKSRTL